MTHASFKTQILGFLAWLAVTSAAGSVGAIASVRATTFYALLSQPSWAPPARLFGPVWTVLYILMALAAWLVWRKHGFTGASTALKLYVIQLIANALWTWLFFALHLGALSFAEIILLWLLIAATLFAFWPLQRLAALMLVPYLAWVSFAAALTYSLWQSNHTALG